MKLLKLQHSLFCLRIVLSDRKELKCHFRCVLALQVLVEGRSGNAFFPIDEVALHWAVLVLRWVTA